MRGGSLTRYYPPDMGGGSIEDTLKDLVRPALAGGLTAVAQRIDRKRNGGSTTVAAPAPHKRARARPATVVAAAPVAAAPVAAPVAVVAAPVRRTRAPARRRTAPTMVPAAPVPVAAAPVPMAAAPVPMAAAPVPMAARPCTDGGSGGRECSTQETCVHGWRGSETP